MDGRPFFMAGLWSEASDPTTGEVADTYTLIITDANAAMRVHDRMPVILATDAARRWIEPGPLPAELLVRGDDRCRFVRCSIRWCCNVRHSHARRRGPVWPSAPDRLVPAHARG